MECRTVSLKVEAILESVTVPSPILGYPSSFSLFDLYLYLDASLRNPVFFQ